MVQSNQMGACATINVAQTSCGDDNGIRCSSPVSRVPKSTTEAPPTGTYTGYRTILACFSHWIIACSSFTSQAELSQLPHNPLLTNSSRNPNENLDHCLFNISIEECYLRKVDIIHFTISNVQNEARKTQNVPVPDKHPSQLHATKDESTKGAAFQSINNSAQPQQLKYQNVHMLNGSPPLPVPTSIGAY